MFTRRPTRSIRGSLERRSRRRSSGRRRRWSSRAPRVLRPRRRSSRLAAEAGSWPEVAEDWQWCARFAYQVIERRGTGGGAFRLDVLALPRGGRPHEAPLAAAAAERWTELAEAFQLASESDEPEPASVAARSAGPPGACWTPSSASGPHSAVIDPRPTRVGRQHDHRWSDIPDRGRRDPQARDQRPRPGRQPRHRRADPDDRRRRRPGPLLLPGRDLVPPPPRREAPAVEERREVREPPRY